MGEIRHISQLAELQKLKTSGTKLKQPFSDGEEPISRRIELLFMGLSATFPGKFGGLFPTSLSRNIAKRVWQTGLQRISDEELAQGLAACSEWQSEFMPTLPEFKQLCRPGSLGRPHAQAYVEFVPGPRSQCDPEAAKKVLLEIRHKLRMKPFEWEDGR